MVANNQDALQQNGPSNGDEVGARDGNAQKAKMAELVEHFEEAIDGQQQARVAAQRAVLTLSLMEFLIMI